MNNVSLHMIFISIYFEAKFQNFNIMGCVNVIWGVKNKLNHEFLVKKQKHFEIQNGKWKNIVHSVSKHTSNIHYIIFFLWKGRHHSKTSSMIIMSSQEKQSEIHVYFVLCVGNSFIRWHVGFMRLRKWLHHFVEIILQ